VTLGVVGMLAVELFETALDVSPLAATRGVMGNRRQESRNDLVRPNKKRCRATHHWIAWPYTGKEVVQTCIAIGLVRWLSASRCP